MVMLIGLRPGASRDNVLDNLNYLRTELFNMRSLDSMSQFAKYIDWVHEAARLLRMQVTEESLDGLVLTRRYWLLQSAVVTQISTMAGLLAVEVEDRHADFDQACKDLDAAIAKWAPAARLVVADTSVYCKAAKLEELDLHQVADVARMDSIRLLVPILVVDELDRLKEVRGNDHVRWRARYTLAVLDRLSIGGGTLRPAEQVGIKGAAEERGAVTIELIFDPPGHRRLPIDDDELVDRALAIQLLAAKMVTMVTYDTGQSTRADQKGLAVVKIPDPAQGGEPPRYTPKGSAELADSTDLNERGRALLRSP